jgi:predicted thioesterase
VVRAEAQLEKVEGRRLVFHVSARDERGLVAAGKVTRVVVDVQERRIIIDTAPAEQGTQAFDSLSFRREAN